MPLHLSDYTPKIKDSLKNGGFACVFVVSTPEGKPSKVSCAKDLWSNVQDIQRNCPMPVSVEEILWCPDFAIARNIAKAAQADTAPMLLHGGWVDMLAPEMVEQLTGAAFRLYRNAMIIRHAELIAAQGMKGT